MILGIAEGSLLTHPAGQDVGGDNQCHLRKRKVLKCCLGWGVENFSLLQNSSFLCLRMHSDFKAVYKLNPLPMTTYLIIKNAGVSFASIAVVSCILKIN